jgi:hypothetical protein
MIFKTYTSRRAIPDGWVFLKPSEWAVNNIESKPGRKKGVIQ